MAKKTILLEELIQSGKRRCPKTWTRLFQFTLIQVLEMNYCWEAMFIPMTTSVSSHTRITYYSFSMRENEFAEQRREITPSLPTIMKALHMHINIFKHPNFIKRVCQAVVLSCPYFFTRLSTLIHKSWIGSSLQESISG